MTRMRAPIDESLWPGVPAPMPRLVNNAVEVVARVGETKTEGRRVSFQPPKRSGVREIFFQHQMSRRTDVERAPRVMLAEARRSDRAENDVDRSTGREFGADDFCLACNRAKSGQRHQLDTVALRSGVHPSPGSRGARHHDDNAVG